MDAGHNRSQRVAGSATWALLGLTGIAAVLRFIGLGQSFTYDEVFTVEIIRSSFVGMLNAIPDSESTPPLFYVLAWSWAKVAGTDEVGLRALSATLGTALVPVAYAAGRSLVTPRVGLVTAAFVAVSPMLVWYAHEARAYTLFALFGTAAIAAFGESLRRPDDDTLLFAWGVLSALALATHYFAVFGILPQALWLLYAHPRRSGVVRAHGPLLVVGVILAPLAIYQARGGYAQWISSQSLVQRTKNTLVEFLWQALPGFARGSI
ncbi:MAG: glycosyltransferase family 39 protein, partial [Thermoleophilia bacterium]|nr:glycosyltransferase family 39 protein [Thermoleophilia bacterium]